MAAVLLLLSPALIQAYTDVDILQFALNLEVRICNLEVRFCKQLYAVATNSATAMASYVLGCLWTSASSYSPAKKTHTPVLQCLEADFYSWVAYGKGIDPDVAGGFLSSVCVPIETVLQSSTTRLTSTAGDGKLTATGSGGLVKTWSTPEGEAIAKEIADNEIAHVKYLRTALKAAGATPVRTLCGMF